MNGLASEAELTNRPPNRLCIPEMFQIKSMLYHYLRAHTTVAGTVAAMASTNSKEVISLVDRVLAEEYVPIAYKKPTCTRVSPSCDFCGASLFNSSWVCGSSPDSKGECARAEADTSPKRVCCLCYVEGRKCACGHMIIQTSFDTDKLLELRNAFVSLVTPSNGPDIVPHIPSTE
jgi:hypothetical protein